VGVLDVFVSKKIRERTADTIADRVEVQVDKRMLEKMTDVATKEDVLVLKSDIQKIEGRVDRLDDKMQSQFRWLMGGIISILLAVISGLVALYLK